MFVVAVNIGGADSNAISTLQSHVGVASITTVQRHVVGSSRYTAVNARSSAQGGQFYTVWFRAHRWVLISTYNAGSVSAGIGQHKYIGCNITCGRKITSVDVAGTRNITTSNITNSTNSTWCG